jgi:hypothetical protein
MAARSESLLHEVALPASAIMPVRLQAVPVEAAPVVLPAPVTAAAPIAAVPPSLPLSAPVLPESVTSEALPR